MVSHGLHQQVELAQSTETQPRADEGHAMWSEAQEKVEQSAK